MANKRVFLAHRLVSNGVGLGGLANIGLAASYRDIVQSGADGSIGTQDVDRAGLRLAASLECEDVTKIADLLSAAVGNTVFSGRESGAATYHNVTVPGIVWTGARIAARKNADATMTCDGVARFSNPAHTLANMIAVAAAAGAPIGSDTYPARLYRPKLASFDPGAAGGGDAIAPLHVESFDFSVRANVIEDYDDSAIGHEAVDIVNWEPPEISLTARDYTAVNPSDRLAALLDAVRGTLTIDFTGRAGAADQTFTCYEVLWTGGDKRQGREYWEYTLTGRASWGAQGTPYTMGGGSPLFSFA